MLLSQIKPTTHMDKNVAESTADLLNADEDNGGWSYRIKPSPQVGKYVIEVSDENGEVLGDL